jgi:hypothetical protein
MTPSSWLLCKKREASAPLGLEVKAKPKVRSSPRCLCARFRETSPFTVDFELRTGVFSLSPHIEEDKSVVEALRPAEFLPCAVFRELAENP